MHVNQYIIIEKSIWPDKFKCSKNKYIQKNNYRTNPPNYRAVSPFSKMVKTLEKVMLPPQYVQFEKLLYYECLKKSIS